ncbi:MAG: class I SAM-dependent methyltransferase [Actinobacteria bacterium]|jgi:SAM-dependent methyltransferase|nr:class I SAM-dependent methyltransferase [Actinomycetota bacterium]
MTADEIRLLAVRADLSPATRLLDLCCGTAGPGSLIAREFGCDYLGVDRNAASLAVARRRTAGLPCRFARRTVPPLPSGQLDVVMLLETLLAFRDKVALVGEIADRLVPGGRFACTVEDGDALTLDERAAMPDPDTVWPVPLGEMSDLLLRTGFRVMWTSDVTAQHFAVADALARQFAESREDIAAEIGVRRIDALIAGHRLWAEWMRAGRIRKHLLIAEKRRGRQAAGRASRHGRRSPSERRCGRDRADG